MSPMAWTGCSPPAARRAKASQVSDDTRRPDTKIVHGGRRTEWLQGMVNVPVARTSTVLFEDVEAMHAAYPPRDGTLSYGRNGTPTHWSLAEALTDLEPGA